MCCRWCTHPIISSLPQLHRRPCCGLSSFTLTSTHVSHFGDPSTSSLLSSLHSTTTTTPRTVVKNTKLKLIECYLVQLRLVYPVVRDELQEAIEGASADKRVALENVKFLFEFLIPVVPFASLPHLVMTRCKIMGWRSAQDLRLPSGKDFAAFSRSMPFWRRKSTPRQWAFSSSTTSICGPSSIQCSRFSTNLHSLLSEKTSSCH